MTTARLSLKEAVEIAAGTLKKAHEDNMNPMAVAVVDEAGTLRCLQTEDDAALMRPDIAYGKACSLAGIEAAGLEAKL